MTSLTETELTTLAGMRGQAAAGEIGYWQIYAWLAELLESKGVPSTNSALLWLRGATEANAGRGAFSALIREYSAAQGLLRYGDAQSDLMQSASDAVAENLLRDLLGESSDWTRGVMPDITRIAESDARAVGRVLFNRDPNDTAAELVQNSAWSGSLLFSLLNFDQTARLTSTGATSASIDIANDWCDASRRLAP